MPPASGGGASQKIFTCESACKHRGLGAVPKAIGKVATLLLRMNGICVVMRLLLLFGGILGFGIGLVFSRIQQNSWPYCLWHGALAAYAGGWLLGWWGRAWQTNLKNTARERQTRPTPAFPTSPISKPSKT